MHIRRYEMKGLVVIIVGAFVLGAAVLAVRSAGAQDREGERPGDKFIAKTAENLGVGAEELTTAMLDAKVSDGTITQAQADRIFAEIEEHIDRIVSFEGDGEGPRPCHRRGADRAARGV